MLTVNKVATILGVSHHTVRRFISEGLLRAHRVGRQYRVMPTDLESYLACNVTEKHELQTINGE